MAIYRGSRYQNTVVYSHIQGKGNVIPTLRRRKLTEIISIQGTVHTFIEGDTLDGLAYKYYGDAQLWWIILDCNPKYLTPWDIRPGDVLSIPSYQEIRRARGL